MSIYPIRDEIVTAKKHHFCDACKTFHDAGVLDSDLTPDELLIVQAARADKWKIKPGDKYRVAVYVYDNITIFRARLDMNNICQKYNLYDE
jgi:hypothetical protein